MVGSRPPGLGVAGQHVGERRRPAPGRRTSTWSTAATSSAHGIVDRRAGVDDHDGARVGGGDPAAPARPARRAGPSSCGRGPPSPTRGRCRRPRRRRRRLGGGGDGPVEQVGGGGRVGTRPGSRPATASCRWRTRRPPRRARPPSARPRPSSSSLPRPKNSVPPGGGGSAKPSSTTLAVDEDAGPARLRRARTCRRRSSSRRDRRAWPAASTPSATVGEAGRRGSSGAAARCPVSTASPVEVAPGEVLDVEAGPAPGGTVAPPTSGGRPAAISQPRSWTTRRRRRAAPGARRAALATAVGRDAGRAAAHDRGGRGVGPDDGHRRTRSGSRGSTPSLAQQHDRLGGRPPGEGAVLGRSTDCSASASAPGRRARRCGRTRVSSGGPAASSVGLVDVAGLDRVGQRRPEGPPGTRHLQVEAGRGRRARCRRRRTSRSRRSRRSPTRSRRMTSSSSALLGDAPAVDPVVRGHQPERAALADASSKGSRYSSRSARSSITE